MARNVDDEFPTYSHLCILITSIVTVVQTSLIHSYSSTDFEVHRNWMAITHQLPTSQWYYENTSEWTLDYPPFFAYFEKGLSTIASFSGLTDILEISAKPLMNNRVLYYQRISVIVTHLFYVLVCYGFCFTNALRWNSVPENARARVQLAAFCLLVANHALVIVDNVHFQYNALLTAILILVVHFADEKKYLLAAVTYCVLINFKHIYLYYAPAFVVFYMKEYLLVCELNKESLGAHVMSVLKKGLVLAFAMTVPFCLAFAPFIANRGTEGVQQIFNRLFPIKRGLTHAYWAPNFWALYNAADLFLFKFAKVVGLHFEVPTYTSGLVQEYSHSVLPSIGPVESLICIIVSLCPLGYVMVKRQMEDFTLLLSLSALSFFFFGYHVHEKALLLIVIPLTITAFSNPRYIGVWHLLSVITSFSLFPLLFTPFEVPLKYVIGAVFFLLCIISVHFAYKLNIWDLIPSVYVWYMIGLVIVEGYNTFVHKVVFGDRLQFFPLMSVSIYNAMGVLSVYKCLLQMALADFLGHEGKKRQLQADEIRVLSNSHAIRQIKELRDVHIVAGVDISTHKTSQELAVVSLCIYSFPDLKLLGTFDEVTLIAEPYISDYLSLREAGPIVRLINRVIRKTPYLKPDVIFTDGNGRFHSRGCGLACHIAFGTNIPTVGVAKNLNLSSLHAVNASSDVIECANKVVEDLRNMDAPDDFYVTFDVIKPVVLNVARLGGSSVPVFISEGLGVELDLATQLVMLCSTNRISVPIRTADLRSREMVRSIFG